MENGNLPKSGGDFCRHKMLTLGQLPMYEMSRHRFGNLVKTRIQVSGASDLFLRMERNEPKNIACPDSGPIGQNA